MSRPFDGPLELRCSDGPIPGPWTTPRSSSPPDVSLDTSLRPEFGQVHPAASLSVSLMRTPRVPGEFRGWPVHAALGRFPIARVAHLGQAVPHHWHESGGVVVPMYRSEAAWLRFRSPSGYPFAVKVLAGGSNAITGETWQAGLTLDPPNHIVVPAQSWLDGVRIGDGRVRQFAADATEPRDGVSCGTRLQLVVTPLRADEWARRTSGRAWPRVHSDHDLWGPDVWDETATQTCVIRMVPAACWPEVFGRPVPHAPLGWHVFERSGLPWSAGFAADADVPHSGVHLVP
jgi:hypothetical protein